ncbi:MAG: 50S ribosomal protein L11 methyltransferase [Acidobacteria bacterium]|nr:50S ribosomal protein L11 methyltransferase [Acidobacteriota bacterium]
MTLWPAILIEFRPTPATQRAPGEQRVLLVSDLNVTAIEEVASDRWRIFFESHADRDRAIVTLQADSSIATLQRVEVPDGDWAIRSQTGLRAVTVDRLTIAPPWDVPAPSGHPLVIIEPSMGFGTGHHASTRLCVRAMQSIGLNGGSVLDVGTGSGVLALAASILGAETVTGIDHDLDSVESARSNLALNPGAHAKFACADVASFAGAPWDVVLANLTAAAICRYAARLGQLLKDGGLLIASGLTQDQEENVLTAFAALSHPLVPARRLVEQEWTAFVLQKSPQRNWKSARATSGVASARNVRRPSVTRSHPDAAACRSSSLVQPPSGPTSIVTASGLAARFFW